MFNFNNIQQSIIKENIALFITHVHPTTLNKVRKCCSATDKVDQINLIKYT